MLTVSCENCKKEYQWSSHITKAPKEVVHEGRTLDTKTTYTVKCPDCGTAEATWTP